MVTSNHPYTALHDQHNLEEHNATRRKRIYITSAIILTIVVVIAAILGSDELKSHTGAKAGSSNGINSSPASNTGGTIPPSTNEPPTTVPTTNEPTTTNTNTTLPVNTTNTSTPVKRAYRCELPNYISKDNQIYAISQNGTAIALQIKGINWFGMESINNIPLGLWDNGITGTTFDKILNFLVANKFNSVRLPINIAGLLQNPIPRQDILNTATNPNVDATSYIALLQSLTLGFASKNISLLLSLHSLKPGAVEGLWYSADFPETSVYNAIQNLTTALCSPRYWNVLGVDVKNEPYGATWGDNQTSTDFQLGATRLGNKLLEGCSQWLVFVEGIYGDMQEININGNVYQYADWWGGGLENARNQPIVLSQPNKVVYAPHYYPPSVYPSSYFYASNMTELSDEDLLTNVRLTMDKMFGFLATTQSYALVLGEFGGLYTTDAHPQKTIQRVIKDNIQLMQRPGFSGGYVWSLNPESLYQYNPFLTKGKYIEGVLQADWKTPNQPYLDVLSGLDQMPNLRMFPCF